MKYRTQFIDYDTAVDIANLCLMNVEKATFAPRLRDKLLAYQVAVRQYQVLRRYVLDVQGWLRNTKQSRDRESLQCAYEIRTTLVALKSMLNSYEVELKKCESPRVSEVRLRAYN